MSDNELNKTNIWKGFIGFLVLISIISVPFIFNFNIGFSVFEGIKTTSLNIFTIIMIIIIIVVIIIVLAFLVIIHKLNNEIRVELNNENK